MTNTHLIKHMLIFGNYKSI